MKMQSWFKAGILALSIPAHGAGAYNHSDETVAITGRHLMPLQAVKGTDLIECGTQYIIPEVDYELRVSPTLRTVLHGFEVAHPKGTQDAWLLPIYTSHEVAGATTALAAPARTHPLTSFNLEISKDDLAKASVPVLRALAYFSLSSPNKEALQQAILNCAWKKSVLDYVTLYTDYVQYRIPPRSQDILFGLGGAAFSYALTLSPLLPTLMQSAPSAHGALCLMGFVLGHSVMRLNSHDLATMTWGLGAHAAWRTLSYIV